MKILDACCGSRMFWFNKEHESALYMDNRTLDTTLCDGRKLVVNPDIVADWKDDIKQGLSECWRVLKENGTLIFKWNEEQVLFSDIKGLLPSKPIIGQRRGKTIWLVFFKG